ncbi:V [Tree shrew adenovirus 1]|uniref:V n=1 Tax=Tree shrew adenovirus serotype 1 TaxID=47680 RepID=A0A2U9AG93_ADET1|nr:V [Tree shrew adenovirus 1] [Tree shrew adenovirus 1]
MNSSRQIKEEMLRVVAPEVYVDSPKRRIKREIKVKIEDSKPVIKKSRKRARNAPEDLDDDLEILGATAKRRPYQWKGRRVRRVLRPGTTVVFSPGQRSATRALKRSADEMMADADILTQAALGEYEFAYGKRRPAYVALDQSNPTPSLEPVTKQEPLPDLKPFVPLPRKRGMEDLAPTVQVLAPKKRRREEMILTGLPGPAPAVSAVDDMLVEDVKPDVGPIEIKPRGLKRVMPGVGVQTVDVAVSTDEPAPAPSIVVKDEPMQVDAVSVSRPKLARRRSRWGPASSLMPDYVLHPSIVPTAGYRGKTYAPGKRSTARRRRTRRRRRTSRRASRVTDGLLLPSVRYHPTITMPTRREMIYLRR